MSEDQFEARIPIRISLDDPEPMYRQIESQLRDFILGGQLPAGTKLPSVRALARDLACSVITTRRAYQVLENAGFIRTRQGMGTVVAELPEEQRVLHLRKPVVRAFREAVEAGRRGGFSDEELRKVFEETLKEGDADAK
jgi:GntR family transcriptional regulator